MLSDLTFGPPSRSNDGSLASSLYKFASVLRCVGLVTNTGSPVSKYKDQ